MVHVYRKTDGGQIVIGGSKAASRYRAATPASGSGAFFWPYDWWLSDRQAGGTLRVGIINLPAGATDVEYKLGNGSWTSGGSTTAFNITGLTNDQSYLVYIRPVLPGGSGAHMLPKKGIPTASPAATLYVDPTGGGDGSYASPYSFSAAVSAATHGTRIVLKDGTYTGAVLSIDKTGTWSPEITVTAENVHAATVTGVRVVNGSGFTIKDLNIGRPTYAGYTYEPVYSEATSGSFTIENLIVKSLADTSTYMTWTAANWTSNTGDLVKTFGSGTFTMRNCLLSVGALAASSAKTGGHTYEYNSSTDMRADGFKLWPNSTYRGNFLANMFSVDANHPDFMQGNTSESDVLANTVIDGNICIEWLYGYDNIPTDIVVTTQGIATYNGTTTGSTITNNIVVCDSQWGIRFKSASTTAIRNNTVIPARTGSTAGIWFTDSSASTAVAYNNIAYSTNFAGSSTGGSNTSITVADKTTLFPGLADFDFRLASGNANLTNGDAAQDTATDIRGVTRSVTTPARGAFEDAYS